MDRSNRDTSARVINASSHDSQFPFSFVRSKGDRDLPTGIARVRIAPLNRRRRVFHRIERFASLAKVVCNHKRSKREGSVFSVRPEQHWLDDWALCVSISHRTEIWVGSASNPLAERIQLAHRIIGHLCALPSSRAENSKS